MGAIINIYISSKACVLATSRVPDLSAAERCGQRTKEMRGDLRRVMCYILVYAYVVCMFYVYIGVPRGEISNALPNAPLIVSCAASLQKHP